MPTNDQCHFCSLTEDRILDETKFCLVILDLYPVPPLHALIITKRHVASYFDLNDQERDDVQRLINKHRERILDEDENVTAFNIGINCGEDAGQTVMHCHIHLIPRRKGDIENPRGGVRGVIPDKRVY
jgi:ATP adenylyltransferase